jgi:hypothetical protein
MSVVDVNTLVRQYLQAPQALTNPLIALIGTRIYQGRLPENVVLPAVSYFVRGGTANPSVVNALSPSIQFDCWAKDDEGPPFVSGVITARNVYRKLYDALQGLYDAPVVIGGTTYFIVKAREEVQGQDLPDAEIPNYFRVLTFFQVTIRDDM